MIIDYSVSTSFLKSEKQERWLAPAYLWHQAKLHAREGYFFFLVQVDPVLC